MRLTLRTLLAYLDDRLAPGQAKEIGQKVTSSPFATELAERIRSVVRRRRLAKEAVGQKSIDANLIAEYLDDQLTPELVALIERQILSSDATLAEVAATHQIIGSLKDPVELGPALKERLYRLGPQPDEEEVDSDGAHGESNWKPLQAQTVRQKRSPMLLLGAMTLGWLALVATDSALFQQPATSTNTGVAQQPEADLLDDGLDAAAPQVADVEGQAPDAVNNAEATASTDPQFSNPSMAGPVPAIDANSDASQVAPVANTPVVTATSEPAAPNANSITTPEGVADADSSAVAAMTDPTATDSTTAPPTAAADQPSTADQSAAGSTNNAAPLALELIDDYSMTVRLADDSETWTWAARDITGTNWTSLLSSSVFGVAAPFDVLLQSPELGWRATMNGPSLFRTSKDGSAVNIIDGDLVLRQLDTGKAPSNFVVQCGGDAFEIVLPDLSSHVGISVRPLPVDVQPDLPDTANTSASTSANASLLPIGRPCLVTVYAADAKAEVVFGDTLVTIPTGMQLKWISNSNVIPSAESSIVPDWVFDAIKRKTESTNDLLAATAAAFRSADSVATAADTLMENRNPLMAGYAMNLPGLTRQLNLLCSTLLETEESVVRQATIDQLQKIQATSPGARDQINELLRSRLPEVDTDNAMKMLVGITPVAAEDRDVSEWLVGMLNDSRVPLRELAIHNLKAITGLTENFLADDDPGRRTSAVRRWTKLLSRNGGRLLPATK